METATAIAVLWYNTIAVLWYNKGHASFEHVLQEIGVLPQKSWPRTLTVAMTCA